MSAPRRAARKAVSSPAGASSGSAFAGAARPIMAHTPISATRVLITHLFCSAATCFRFLTQLCIRRHDSGLLWLGQVHRMNAGFLGQLFEQAVKTLLIDGVVPAPCLPAHRPKALQI